jgi:hypothetical protein
MQTVLDPMGRLNAGTEQRLLWLGNTSETSDMSENVLYSSRTEGYANNQREWQEESLVSCDVFSPMFIKKCSTFSCVVNIACQLGHGANLSFGQLS